MSTDRSSRVGFIGLGTMGSLMAANLQAGGCGIVVSDIAAGAADDLLAKGAEWAGDPLSVAEHCATVFTSLPGPREVETVILGERGVAEGMREGDLVIDLSTNSPSVARRIHETLAGRRIGFLDAPVSGGPGGARSGRLAILVGGEEADFDRARPLLDLIGDQPLHVGKGGAGLVAKLVHNAASYGVNALLAEVFTLGVKGGVEPLALWDAMRKGAMGRRRTFDGLAPQFLPDTYDPPAFALRLARKDVSLACALGREAAVPMRLTNMVLEEMTEAGNRGWDARDSRVFMKLQKERAGVEIAEASEEIKAIMAADKG